MKIDPSKSFDECEDFLITVVEGLIVAAAMSLFKMSSIDEIPKDISEEFWLSTKEERTAKLNVLTDGIYDRFVKASYCTTRVDDGDTTSDEIFDYSESLISIGLFYIEFRDSIKEGDGIRVLRCWQYLLPIFFNTNRTNYAREALIMLSQHKYLLTERQSMQLLYSRFVNVHGIIGRNIPCDLHMEHLNKVCKSCIRDLGANKNEENTVKVSKCIGTVESVISKFDLENDVPTSWGSHSRASAEEDIKLIVTQYEKTRLNAQKLETEIHAFLK